MNLSKKVLSLVLVGIALPLVASAAGLTYSADTTVALTSPAINLTILQSSTANSLVVNSGNVVVMAQAGDVFAITSSSRGLAANGVTDSAAVTISCNSSQVQTVRIAPTTTTETIIITPTGSLCSPPIVGGGGGGGGGFCCVAPPASQPPAPSVPKITSPGLEQFPSYPVGTLVQPQGDTIYLITEPYVAVGFTTWRAFVGLGYQLRYVVRDNLPGYQIPTSYFLSSPTQAHPWTAWVNYKRTVYYVNPQGLIGVPSWDIFLSNGGQPKYILPANKADIVTLKKNAYLPLLKPNDSRVVK
jgi:hypothetical protein